MNKNKSMETVVKVANDSATKIAAEYKNFNLFRKTVKKKTVKKQKSQFQRDYNKRELTFFYELEKELMNECYVKMA